MCQELWHFLPTLPSNVKVSIHIAWHIIATQIFKSQLHFLWELSVCHSHMVTTRGHLMGIQEMRECRPSPKLTSAPPPSHAEEFPWSLVKLCGKFVGTGRSEGIMPSAPMWNLPDTTALPLPSQHLPSPPGSKRGMLLTLWDSDWGNWPPQVPKCLRNDPFKLSQSQRNIFP